jgi:hypothetical protein
MKKFLLWSFERGSVQYDVICVIIIAFIFLTPPAAFNDRPRRTSDVNGHTVFTVKGEKGTEQAVARLKGIERLEK